MFRISAICCLLLLAVNAPARSQFTQYTPPGAATRAPENAAESADEGAENARWRFGRLRLHPHLNLSDVGYVQNVFSVPDETTQVDDSHATLGAGLAGYVRLGSNSLLSGYVAPEYFWWQDSSELRELTVNSGLAWFGSFNRLTLSSSLRSTERQRPLSTEVEAPVKISSDSLGVEAKVELTRRLAIFGVATESKDRHGGKTEQFVPGLVLLELDRDSSNRIIGLELRGSEIALGLGYQTTEVDFVSSESRDNSGEGLSIDLNYDHNNLAFALRYSDLNIDFESLDDRTETVGSALIAFKLRPKTTLSVYSSEGLAFTAISDTGIIETESRGINVRQALGRRFESSVFIETGTQSFIDTQNTGRVDDLEAIGLRVRVKLRAGLVLTGQIREETWDSTFAEFDRSASALGIGIEFGGDLLPW